MTNEFNHIDGMFQFDLLMSVFHRPVWGEENVELVSEANLSRSWMRGREFANSFKPTPTPSSNVNIGSQMFTVFSYSIFAHLLFAVRCGLARLNANNLERIPLCPPEDRY